MFMRLNDNFRLLRRVYESGRAGDPNVMEELADLIGPELGKYASNVKDAFWLAAAIPMSMRLADSAM